MADRCALKPGAGRDQPADDHVFLQARTVRPIARRSAASVSTFGVSWKEAAEMNESDCRAALVTPMSTGLATAGLPPVGFRAPVLLAEGEPVHQRAGQELRVARVVHAHLAHHLADDDLDVLVVDAHVLRTVDVLHLAQEVLLHFFFAADAQDVLRDERAFGERLARADAGAAVDAQVPAARHEVLALHAAVGADDDAHLAAPGLADLDDAFDLADDRRVLRLARLEQLRHARQTAGDVLRAGDLARRLGQQRAGA